MKEALRNWLNGGRNYQDGVRLYLSYGNNQLLKDLFTKEHETDFKRQRLVKEIKILLQPDKIVVQQTPFEKESGSESQFVCHLHNRWPDDPVSDPVLKVLKDQWRIYYSEMMNLSHRLFDITSDIERGKCAHRILELDVLCDELYNKRDYYSIHKLLPDQKKADVVTDPNRWPLKLMNAERYVREYRIRCKAEPGNEKFALKLKYYQDAVLAYKELLKM